MREHDDGGEPTAQSSGAPPPATNPLDPVDPLPGEDADQYIWRVGRLHLADPDRTGHVTDFATVAGAYGSNGHPQVSPVLVRLADVEPETVRWLWPGRIPRGKLTLLDGDPGLGKSTLALDLAARVTTGRAFADGAPADAGGVVILTAEDGLADTVRPRLDAMGGDPELVHVLEAVMDEHGRHPVSLPDHIAALCAAITAVEAVLVIIDPFTAFLASYVNSRIDHDVRRTLAPLAALAAETDVATLLIRHLNKSPGAPALYRGGGSIGLIAAARAGLLVAEDPDDVSRRILAVVKANLAPRAASLAYRLEEAANGVARVVWAGESPHSANALLATSGDPGERSALEDAKAFLRGFLADGPRLAEEIHKAARKEGHADKTLRRAKGEGGVRALRDGFGSGSKWYWALEDGQEPPKMANTQTLATFGVPSGSNPASSKDLVEDGQRWPSSLATFDAETSDALPPGLAAEWAEVPLGEPDEDGNEAAP